MTDLHVILTEAGSQYGWTIESPQLPELIGGSFSGEQLVAETADILRWARDPDVAYGQLFVHEQHLVRNPDGVPFLIRWQFHGGDDAEATYDERYHTASRLNYAVSHGLYPEYYDQHPVISTTGERLYIAVVGTDRMGWIEDQLSVRDSCCVLAQHLGDGSVLQLPFGDTGTLDEATDSKLLGLGPTSTVDEMTEAVLNREVESLRKTYFPADALSDVPRRIPGTAHIVTTR